MNVIQSWKESIGFFRPSNLKLFFLVTIKTIKEIYLFLFKYFWWLILLYLILEFSFVFLDLPFMYAKVIQALIIILWTFFICLSARASVGIKSAEYFIYYVRYLPGMFIGIWFISLLFSVFSGVGAWLLPSQFEGWAALGISNALNAMSLLFVFFLFDMPLALENWARALYFSFLMFIFNIVSIMVLIALVQIIYFLVLYGFMFVCEGDICTHIESIYNLLKEPIMICVVSNFYIKRLHEQPQLYFHQPKE